jgi:hypothetical protein
MSDTLGRLRQAQSYFDTSYPPSIYPPDTPAVLSALNPTSITAGDPPVLITVTGSGFTASSVVWADEEAQFTTFVSDTELTYNAQADQAGTQTITVQHRGMSSNAIELTVDAGVTLTSVSPNPADQDQDLTLTGTGLDGVTMVRLNNAAGTTVVGLNTFVSQTATQIVVNLNSASGDYTGVLTVDVWNGPADRDSNKLPLTVNIPT